MDCPHCGKGFHEQWQNSLFYGATGAHPFRWDARVAICPACKDAVVDIWRLQGSTNEPVATIRAYPRTTFRRPTPQEVPAHIRQDYEEAWSVLPISNKASAALSRRCLQAILREQGYPQHDLARQIDALLNETDPAKAIPTAVRHAVDAIRNFGNFSAHPITDRTTLQIVAVDPGEAEWSVEILDEMFDHYYVKPAQVLARKAALDAKLAAAGKPPSK
jgi:phage terminase large subunit GpA-like protein